MIWRPGLSAVSAGRPRESCGRGAGSVVRRRRERISNAL